MHRSSFVAMLAITLVVTTTLIVLNLGSSMVHTQSAPTDLWKFSTRDMVISSPALGEFDGDGKLDVVVGSIDGTIYALDGGDGNLLWNYTTKDNGVSYESSPALGDVDSDGKLEVVVTIDNSGIYCLNSEDGSLLWNYTTPWCLSYLFFSSPALGDVDGDGKLEVIVGVGNCHADASILETIYCLNGEDGSLLWNYTTPWFFYLSSPALGDVDGDGKLEVVVGVDDEEIYCLNGEDGSLLWNYTIGKAAWSSPALGDVDGDGKLEVVVGVDDEGIYCLNGEDGSLLWNYTTPWFFYLSPLALGDVDNDGKLEILVGSDDEEIYCLNGEDGSLLWNYTIEQGIRSSPALGDVDGDGKFEVIVGSNDRGIYCLNGEDGSLLWNYTIVPSNATWGEIWSSPALGDVDGDGRLEVVVGSNDKNVHCLDISNAGFRSIWRGLGGDFNRAGNMNFIDSDMDGLSYWDEKHLGTNPQLWDTDGDFIGDGQDPFPTNWFLPYNIFVLFGAVGASAFVLRERLKIESKMNRVGYKIIGVMMRNMFITVYKAKAKSLKNQMVTLKILKIREKEVKKKFVKIVSAWKLLNHPNIVRVFDFGVEPIQYVVTELVGKTLCQELEERRRFIVKDAVNIALQLAAALNYAHTSFNMVHGDVRLENVVHNKGMYKLDNWGLLDLQRQVSLLRTVERDKNVLCRAPEQIDPSIGDVGPWTDVWSLGIVLSGLLIGKNQVELKPDALEMGNYEEEVKKLAEEVKRENPELGNLIERMLNMNPKERLSMSRVEEELKKIKEKLK